MSSNNNKNDDNSNAVDSAMSSSSTSEVDDDVTGGGGGSLLKQTLMNVDECFLYKLPPLATSGGYRGKCNTHTSFFAVILPPLVFFIFLVD
jgi:dihydrofolate reductase